MLKSLYSGISGMRVNQTKLDVIGNNISNVGTTAFKSSNARFSDMLSQTVSDAMAPSSKQGGTNAKQVGLGVQISSIANVMTQGSMQPTNRALDVAIDGTGYFMVSKGPTVFDDSIKINHKVGAHNMTGQDGESASEILYTRDGSFTLDEEGNLLTSDGSRILGYSLTNDDNSKPATAISPGEVTIADNDDTLTFNFGPGSQLNGYKFVLGTVAAGTVTSAEVDNTAKTIKINGDFATNGALTPAQIELAVNKALSTAGISQSVLASGDIPQAAASGAESGAISGGTPSESIDDNGAIFFVDATLDLKAYDGELKTLRIPEKVKMPGSDTELRIRSYTIDVNGIINGVLEDGRVAALGQIAMASFRNEEGLTKLGGNMYGSSVNSGEAVIKSGVGTIEDDNSNGYGSNVQGMLEMSNVDLAEQFTEMIVASRAFQAAGKMITTGDEILQDIINLKR
jgi:flagellar hook protein FlgE